MLTTNESHGGKTARTFALVVIAIIAASTLAYFSSQWWTQEEAGSKEHMSLKSVSLRASPSLPYYSSLFANLSASSALNKWAAFINGVGVFGESLNQADISTHYQGFGVIVRNVSVVLGKSYTVTFKATFSDGFVNTVSATVIAVVPPPSSISLDSWELCLRNCGYPSPFFEAYVFIKSSVPLSTLHLLINRTSQGVYDYPQFHTAACCLLFTQLWKSGVDNQTMPVIAGRTYSIEFVATFLDNSTYLVHSLGWELYHQLLLV